MSGRVIAAGVFLASYVSWRPTDILFTASDMFFVLGVGLLIAAQRVPLQPFGRATSWWMMATVALLGGLFLGSIVNGDPERWLIAGAQYSFSLIVLPILLMDNGAVRHVMLAKALVTGVVAMEAFGIAMYFGTDLAYEEYGRYGHDFITGAGRLGAFLGDANWNAAAIVMALPFALYLRARHHSGALAFYLVLAVLLCSLFLSASVTGLVSCLLAVSIFTVVGGVRPPAKMIVGVAVALMLAIASGYGLPRAFEKRIAPAVEDADFSKAGTFTGRMDLIHEAWGIVNNTTVVGLGADQYRKVSVDKAPVHNIFLLLWAEGGLFALVGWLALLGIAAGGGLLARATDRLAAALCLSVVSTFVIFSGAAPHMYARIWMVPLLLAASPAFATLVERKSLRPGAHGFSKAWS
jgi:O-antigen ligase